MAGQPSAGPALNLIGSLDERDCPARLSTVLLSRGSTRLVEPEGNPLVVATRDEPAEALLGGTGIIRLATQLPNLLDGALDVVDMEVGHDLPDRRHAAASAGVSLADVRRHRLVTFAASDPIGSSLQTPGHGPRPVWRLKEA